MCLSMVQHSRKEAGGIGGWALKRVTRQPFKSEQEANCEVSGAAHAPSVSTYFCALAKIHLTHPSACTLHSIESIELWDRSGLSIGGTRC